MNDDRPCDGPPTPTRPRVRSVIVLAALLVLAVASAGIGAGAGAGTGSTARSARRVPSETPAVVSAGSSPAANGTTENGTTATAETTPAGTTATTAARTTTSTRTSTTRTTAATAGTSVSILAGAVTPSAVDAGAAVSDQRVAVYLSGVSADGERDTHYLAVPDALASNLSVADATATGNATVVSTTLVDGFDGDGTTDTVAVVTNAAGGGTVSPVVAVRVSTAYPPSPAAYPIHARVVDSTGSTATKRDVATVIATGASSAGSARSGELPVITGFQLNATDQDVDVFVSSTEDLETLKVKVKSETKTLTLTREDFTESTRSPDGRSRFVYNQDVNVFLNNASTGDVGKLKVKVKSKVKKIVIDPATTTNDTRPRYVYRANVSEGRDGTFRARLLEASSGGRDAVVGQRETVTVDTSSGGGAVPFLAGLAVGIGSVGAAVVYRRRRSDADGSPSGPSED